MEEENTLVFKVAVSATKASVRAAFNLIYNASNDEKKKAPEDY